MNLLFKSSENFGDESLLSFVVIYELIYHQNLFFLINTET